MRTTVNLPDDVLAEAKVRAAREGRTLSDVVVDALRASFTRASEGGRQPVQLTTFRGNGLRPGVDLDNNAALLDLMESDD